MTRKLPAFGAMLGFLNFNLSSAAEACDEDFLGIHQTEDLIKKSDTVAV